MKRLDHIYQFVKEQTAFLTQEELDLGKGITTSDIAKALNLQRANVSKDLNTLVRDGQLIKLDGRPVRYVDIRVKWHKPLVKNVISYKQNDPPKSIPADSPIKPVEENVEDIFPKIIGSSGSMKTQVEQAKAAILYPPKGLNCLITGQTGTGKTFFAHAMFRFAKASKIIPADKELVIFNCADYAHNPELLMSHLFGYKKGSFTGATESTEGLIQRADKSMLFLDEVHRLPPEGQEMIFYFMDHGTYSRLGEVAKEHQADVRIICATTEDPNSALLQTFVRRIPIVIQLPIFNERPAKEKIDLLKNMISLEAARIQREITLPEDVVKALIGSVTYGNVGQLKSNVQLVCAKGFLNHMDQPVISIALENLTPEIREGIMQLASNRDSLSEISRYLDAQMTISPNEQPLTISEDAYELPFNLYEIIGDKAALLKNEGLDQEHINNFITTDINIHLKSFYKNNDFNTGAEDKLAEIVDKKIIDITKDIYSYATSELKYPFHPNFIYAMSLHISSFLKRIQLGQKNRTININIKNMVADYPTEFRVSKKIKQMLQDSYQIQIPEGEIYYLTVLLASLRAETITGEIGIVVAAHGKTTATSMVQVVSSLLGTDHLRAVDMPLEMNPNDARKKIIEMVQDVDRGSGTILLVDMGSLATFSEEITEKTGILVRTVDMVTTPMILEAARKASLLDTSLMDLYESLKNFRGYAQNSVKKIAPSENLPYPELPKAIVAICSSGEGTAVQMKNMIEENLIDHFDQEIEIFPISVIDMKTSLFDIQQKYQIIAVTGVIDPKIKAPYIQMEAFFTGDSQKIIDQIIDRSFSEQTPQLDETAAKEICHQYMEKSFTFINAGKVLDPLWHFVSLIQKNYIEFFPYSFYITLIMHLAGMLERILKNDILVVDIAVDNLAATADYKKILTGIHFLEGSFNMKVPDEEIYYIIQLIQTQTNL